MRLRIKSLGIVMYCGLLMLVSCDDTEFNSPAFQADLNYNLWRADAFSARYNASGNLVISGTNNIETVILTLENNTVGTQELGSLYPSRAEFIDGFGTVFTTAVEPDENESIYLDLGQVEITQINTSSNRVSGNFYFTAYDEEGQNPVGLSNGIFFEVKIREN